MGPRRQVEQNCGVPSDGLTLCKCGDVVLYFRGWIISANTSYRDFILKLTQVNI